MKLKKEKEILAKKFLPFMKNLCEEINKKVEEKEVKIFVQPLNIFEESDAITLESGRICFNLDIFNENLSTSEEKIKLVIIEILNEIINEQSLYDYIEMGETQIHTQFLDLYLYKDISTNILNRIKDKV